MGHRKREVAVYVGDGAVAGAFLHHGGANDSLACLVGHYAVHFYVLRSKAQRHQHAQHNEHHELFKRFVHKVLFF